MNDQQFFKSFSFKKYAYDKNRHTDNCTHHGAEKNFIGKLIKGSARLVSSAGTVQLLEKSILNIGRLYCFLADIAPSLQIDTDPAALTVRKAIACMRADFPASEQKGRGLGRAVNCRF